jgi:glycosyltransferase involved in cell wall biosynthesis
MRGLERARILYLIWSLDLGGAEQVIIDLVRHIDRTQFQPAVCCLNEKGRLASSLEKEGIPVVALQHHARSLFFSFDPSIVLALCRLVRKWKIDLIHTHLFSANLWGRIAAKCTGIPVVSSEHGVDAWRNPLHLTLDLVLTLVSKRVIFVSQALREFHARLNPFLKRRSCVIYNGIEFKKFEIDASPAEIRKTIGLDKSHTVLGIVGRVAREKAHVDFIHVVQRLTQEHAGVVGLIVGEGELLNELKKLVNKKGIQDHIVFLGYRNDLPRIYQAMDVFVMTSLSEGFPLAVLEAMAAGVPIVATNVGGIPECVKDGEDGRLVSPGDRSAMTQAISNILTDPVLALSLAANARKRVKEHFSLEAMVRNYESLYRYILASQR